MEKDFDKAEQKARDWADSVNLKYDVVEYNGDGEFEFYFNGELVDTVLAEY